MMYTVFGAGSPEEAPGLRKIYDLTVDGGTDVDHTVDLDPAGVYLLAAVGWTISTGRLYGSTYRLIMAPMDPAYGAYAATGAVAASSGTTPIDITLTAGTELTWSAHTNALRCRVMLYRLD